MYPGIEWRHYRYAVVLAEELNFSRAAERLHVSQPTLSKQIGDLEDRLGKPLFLRNKRNVSLTEAGKLFVEEARKALRQSEQAIHVVKTYAPPNRFWVGYSPWVNHALSMEVRDFFAEQLPEVDLRLRSAFTNELVPWLQNGELDAALVILPLQDESLRYEVILRESLLVALPEQHPMARKKTVMLSDLNGMPAISVPERLNPGFHEFLMNSCARHGLTVTVAQEVSTYSETLFLVSQGIGFTLARECFRPESHRGIVFRPIKGNPLSIVTAIAYKRQSAYLSACLAVLARRRGPQSERLSNSESDSLSASA